MSRICPETGERVLYTTCLECGEKTCRKMRRKLTVEEYYGNLQRFADPVEMGWEVMEEMDALDHYYGADGKKDYGFYAGLCLERGYKGILDIGCAFGFQSELFTGKGLRYCGIDDTCTKFWDADNPLSIYMTARYPCAMPGAMKDGTLPVSRMCLGYFLEDPEPLAGDFGEILIDGETEEFFRKMDGLYEKKETFEEKGTGCVLYSRPVKK